MDKILSKVKNNKNWGIILAVLAGLKFLSEIIWYISAGIKGRGINVGEMIILFIEFIAVAAIGAYMFYFRKFLKPMLPISIAVVALCDILMFFFSQTFSILYILDALCLLFIGYAIFEGGKNMKLAFDFCIGLMIFNVIWAVTGFMFAQVVQIGGYGIFNASVASAGYLGLGMHIVLASYIYRKLQKEGRPEEKQEEPVERTEQPEEDDTERQEGLKKLLDMTEKQFEDGKIDEKEYIRRKTEILSRM